MGKDLSANTVQQRQTSARVFYHYHSDLGVDPNAIHIVKIEPSAVDPRDLFTRDDIDAIHEVIDNPRDRAIVDMCLYTGQRIRALQSLKVTDVDIEEGRFYLNPEAFGLKGAKGMRSLLIAKGAAAEWMDYHPAPDDPDAYFITKLPDAARGDPTKPLYQSTINRRIQAIAKEAGIERPEERGHAHNLRHTFVRWAYISREMDLATIKWMMGHAKDSRTLEETYFNILDVDHAKKAEQAAGLRTEEEMDLTPETCHVCEFAPIPDGSLFCPRCTTELTPDAADKKKSVQEQSEERIPEVQNETEARIVRAALRELRENPQDALDE
jgi:integrase